jgi:hypothetical protein
MEDGLAEEKSIEIAIPSVVGGGVQASVPSWQDQDDRLREMWLQNNTPAQIAETLGRSVAAIMTRAVRLGLPRRAAPGRKPGYKRAPSTLRPPKKVSAGVAKLNRDAALVHEVEEARRENPQAAERICLMCLRSFLSEGRHNRICPACKGTAQYASASSLPDMGFKVET